MVWTKNRVQLRWQLCPLTETLRLQSAHIFLWFRLEEVQLEERESRRLSDTTSSKKIS